MTREHSKSPGTRSPWRDPWVYVVVALALGLRAAYLVDLRGTPFFAHPQMDALYHDRWARELASGAWWGSEVFFRAPLYPYLLGAWYAVVGTDPLGPRILQLCIGSGTALLTVVLPYRHLGRTAALTAGFFVALSGPLIYFEGELLLVVLEAPLGLLAAWSVDRAWRSERPAAWGVAGVWIGVGALVRPTILAAVPVIAFALLLRRRRRALPAMLALIGCTLLLISPALVRNWMVGRDLVPVAAQGGLNYYLGNNPAADGMAALAPEFRKTWSGGIEDSRRLAETERGRPLKASEVSRHWFGKSVHWATTDPIAWGTLQLRKLAYFWDAYEIPNNQDYYYFSSLARTHRLPLVGFGLLGPLALAGLFLGWRRGRLGFGWVTIPLVLMAVIVAFFVCGRFRASLIPLFAVWAGVGVTLFLEAARRDRQRALWIGGSVLLVALFLNLDPWGHRRNHGPAESHLRLGIHYAGLGDAEAAALHYQNAIAEQPRFAEAWNNLGVLRASNGDPGGAREAFEQALQSNPDHPKALANLAKLHFDMGERESAGLRARDALRVAGREPVALQTAATVLGNLGRFDEALDAFRVLRALDPDNPAGVTGEVRALILLDRPGEALEILRALPPGRLTGELRRLLEDLS